MKKAKKEVCDEFCQRKKSAIEQQNVKRTEGYREVSKKPKSISKPGVKVSGFFM